MSSWQDYIDNELIGSRCVTAAAIIQLDGVTLAASNGFVISVAEVQFIVDGMKDVNLFYTKGVRINGTRCIYQSGSDHIVRAKRDAISGIYIYKTDKLLIVGAYDEPIKPTQAASVVDSLAASLIAQGY